MSTSLERISPRSEQFEHIIEEIEAIYTEAEFHARWTIVEAHHQVGLIILSQKEKERTNLVQRVAVELNRSERTVWYAVKLAETYPDLNELPGGKSVSWSRIIKKHLTDGKELNENDEKSHECVYVEICETCRRPKS